jgi:hypothetical protein
MNFASIVAQNERAQLRGATIGLYFRVVSRFDLAPLQGASLRGGRFPGLKPWAKSCSPFGAGPSGRRITGAKQIPGFTPGLFPQNRVGPEEAGRYGEDWLPIGTVRIPFGFSHLCNL